jgi:hypothetical protein
MDRVIVSCHYKCFFSSAASADELAGSVPLGKASMALQEGVAIDDQAGDPVQVTIVLQPAGSGRNSYLTSLTVGDRPPVSGSFELPANRGWDEIYEGAQTSKDGASAGAAVETGMRLFDALFSGPLRRCWAQVVEESRCHEMRLTIQSDALAVHGLPWELLFDRVLVDRHLALVEGWSVARAVLYPPPVPEPVRSVADLHVVVVTSRAGTDEPETDFEIIKEAWPGASVRLCHANRTADIAAALDAQHVDVVHIASTGVELRDGRQQIALGDPSSTDPMAVVVLVSAGELLELLGENGWPRLVVLAGSDTEVLAAELARKVSAVVGLRSAVSDEECDPFLRDFYPALGRAESLDQAMTAGRARQRAVTSALGTDWAAPVGYFTCGQRLVTPGPPAESPEPTPVHSAPAIVLTGSAPADRVELELEISRLNLETMVEKWSQVDEQLWPELVTGRHAVLEADVNRVTRRDSPAQ